jgi:hypothetical protein
MQQVTANVPVERSGRFRASQPAVAGGERVVAEPGELPHLKHAATVPRP